MDIGATQNTGYVTLKCLGTTLSLTVCLSLSAAAMARDGNAVMVTGGKYYPVSAMDTRRDIAPWFDAISSPLVESVDTAMLALKTQTRVGRLVAETDSGSDRQGPSRSQTYHYRQALAVSSADSNGGGSHDPLTLSLMATLLLLLRYRDKD
jgi:hypothetical protein